MHEDMNFQFYGNSPNRMVEKKLKLDIVDHAV